MIPTEKLIYPVGVTPVIRMVLAYITPIRIGYLGGHLVGLMMVGA
jgi:hypothetical protein